MHMTSMRNGLGLLLVFLPLLAGCSSSPPGTYPVYGTVTFNEEPLREGNIIFSNADGTGVTLPVIYTASRQQNTYTYSYDPNAGDYGSFTIEILAPAEI